MQRRRAKYITVLIALLSLWIGGYVAQAEEILYALADGITVDVLINPYPNQAPYTAELPSGEIIFNPLAIQDVRFAIHQLINRTSIATEISPDAGAALIVPAIIGDSDPCSLEAVSENLGISYQANVAIGLAAIRRAMEEAAQIPENVSHLTQGEDGIWEWDGVDIVIPIGIRSDHEGQNIMGHCVADAMEKTGFIIERHEQAAQPLMTAVYMSALNELSWRVVTEGWGSASGSDAAGNIAHQFAPSTASYGSAISEPTGDEWTYENDQLDDASASLMAAIESGDRSSYCQSLQQVVHWGLHDAIRIYIAHYPR